MEDGVVYEDGSLAQRQNDAFTRITEFLDGYMDDYEGHMYLFEFGTFIYAMLWKMRQTLTFEDMGSYVVGLLNVTEYGIRQAKKEHGDEMLIAEDWTNIEGGDEMLRSLSQMMKSDNLTIPEAWLEEE